MAQVVRVLPTGMALETKKQHTRPIKLVRIGFRNGNRYYSTGPLVTMDSIAYLPDLISVGELSWGPDGDQSGTIEIYNDANNYAATLVLAARIAEVPVTIWEGYIKDDGTAVVTVMAVGILTDSTVTPTSAVVTMVTQNMGAERQPNRPVTYEEGFKWLPPEGGQIDWGNETYVFERD